MAPAAGKIRLALSPPSAQIRYRVRRSKSYRFSLALILLTVPVAVAQPPSVGNCTVFPADNIWNTPVDQLPVASNSSTYVNTIGAGTIVHADFGAGLWAGGPIGIPYLTVPGTQTKYPATFLYYDESDPGPYAVPLNVPIEGGSQSTGDRHALVIDQDHCILYELGRAFPQAASWQADAGAIFNLLSNALRPATWTSTDAAGLSVCAGLVRYDEIASGEIRHALRFTVPHTRRAYVWPARHYASSITDPAYPPMGLRVRLRASFDITGYSAVNQIILRALKKYGMMLSDNGSAWYITGAPDSRWNNSDLQKLGMITGADFEVVDVSGLMVDPNTGQVRAAAPAILTIGKTHSGSFSQGQSAATYTVTVSNSAAAGPAGGIVTVTETVPAGLTLTSMAGVGWTCPAGAKQCTRSDALPAGASYPAITVTVNVAAAAASPQVNRVAVSGGGSASAAATDSTTIWPAFTDVASSDSFFSAVNLIREYGITGGCQASPPMYCPNDNVTRAQMAIFVVRSVMGGDNFTYSGTPYFTDVPATAFGFKWIQKARELNISSGCGNNGYCPNDLVTRGQMAIFVTRARLGAAADGTFSYPSTPYFTDVPSAHPYFKWIQRMKLEQITGGCGTGSTYCPDAPVTRGQMAIFIVRGAFNQLLPNGTPVIAAANPAAVNAGQTAAVTIRGVNTNFAQAITQVSAGPGITASNTQVTNAGTLTVQLTVAANAAAGPRTIVVTTGAEQAILPNGLSVP